MKIHDVNALSQIIEIGLDGQWEPFDDWVSENSDFTFDNDYNHSLINEFDNEVFVLMINMIKDDRFKLNPSYSAIYIFIYDWSTLSSSQRGYLIQTVDEVWIHIRDMDLLFSMSEMLGKYFKNNEAIRTLHSMRNSDEVNHVLASTLGLYYMAKSSPDRDLCRESVKCLAELSNHKDPDVRDEAQGFLFKIEDLAI